MVFLMKNLDENLQEERIRIKISDEELKGFKTYTIDELRKEYEKKISDVEASLSQIIQSYGWKNS